MKGLVAAVSDAVPGGCRSNSCSKEGCTLSVGIAKVKRILVDLDCPDLHIPPDLKRCDYVFVGEKNTKAWVAPIELKSGRFDAAKVIDQLQGGAETVKAWLPDDSAFQFVPVLAHGRDLRIKQRNELRSHTVHLCGQTRRVALVRCGGKRCGGKLKDALDAR